MAAIAFNAAQRAAERLEAVLTAVGEKFDVFVSYEMRQAAAEAEPARTPPGDELAGIITPFRPLDAGIVRSGPVGCATIFPADRFELDLKNNGNPLIPVLRPLMRLALHLLRRALAGVGQITAAIERRTKA